MTVLAAPSPNNGMMNANLICMASMLVWAAALPAADFLIGRVPPLELTAMRMGLAGLCLLPLWWAIEGGTAVRRAPWLRGLGIGALFALGGLLLIVSQTLTDAVTVAIVSALLPIIGIGLEVVFDGRRLTAALVIGILLSCIGGIIAYAARLDEFGLGWGAAAAVGSNIVYAAASRLAITGLPGMSPLGRAGLSLSGAGVVALLVAAIHTGATGATGWGSFGWQQAAALAVFSIGGMAIAQLLWITSIGKLGIGVSSLHINAAAFYVMVFAWLLGAAWNWIQVVGAVIVAAGVLVAQGVIPLPGLRHAER